MNEALLKAHARARAWRREYTRKKLHGKRPRIRYGDHWRRRIWS